MTFVSNSVPTVVELDFQKKGAEEVPVSGKSFSTMCFGAVQEAWGLACRLGDPSGAIVHVSVSSDVPMGAGLSSSAALLVSLVSGLVTIFLDLPATSQFSKEVRTQVAVAAREVENKYCGVQVGIMDQYASVHGVPNTVMRVDCAAMIHTLVPIPQGVGIVLLNSMKAHELLGQYNAIRSDLEVAEGALRTLSGSPMTTLSSSVGRRFQVGVEGEVVDVSSCFAHLHATGVLSQLQANRGAYAVSEMQRVEEFLAVADAHAKGEDKVVGGDRDTLRSLGSILYAGHDGLSNQLGVSTPELDTLVSLCQQHPNAIYGARMMGGGFGGCVIALVDPDLFTDPVRLAIRSGFTSACPGVPPCDMYTVTIGPGSYVTRR